jgi:hypothetical protein
MGMLLGNPVYPESSGTVCLRNPAERCQKAELAERGFDPVRERTDPSGRL